MGGSRTPATSKMEIFVKESDKGKPLIINTKRTILDVAGDLWSIYIFAYIPIQYEILGPNCSDCRQWAYEPSKSNCTKSFFVDHFLKKLCA